MERLHRSWPVGALGVFDLLGAHQRIDYQGINQSALTCTARLERMNDSLRKQGFEYPRTPFREVAWSMLNQELSIVRASICSRVKSLEWVKNPALFHAFSSLSFFVFEAS